MVSMRKPPSVSGLRQVKRKRLTTPVKKRNIKYKPAQKQERLNCVLCDFTSNNNVKLKTHIKNYHTEPKVSLVVTATQQPVAKVEDMSLCGLSESEDEELVEITNCTKCTFEASTEGELERHLEDLHRVTINTLEKGTVSSDNDTLAPPRVKSLPLYKCNECAFTAMSIWSNDRA